MNGLDAKSKSFAGVKLASLSTYDIIGVYTCAFLFGRRFSPFRSC
jgi:hypothetical protein